MFRTTANNHKAFTLVEVVIAIAILAVVFAVAYRALSQISRSKSLLDDERGIVQVASMLTNRLSRELQMAIADERVVYPGVSELNFKGEDQGIGEKASDSIIFVANEAGQYISEGQRHSGLVTLSYRLAEDPERQDDRRLLLIRDEIPNLQEEELAFEQRVTFPITDRITALEFRYFNFTDKSWQNQWEEDASLPALVYVRFTLLSDLDREFSFTTVIPIKAGATIKDNRR